MELEGADLDHAHPAEREVEQDRLLDPRVRDPPVRRAVAAWRRDLAVRLRGLVGLRDAEQALIEALDCAEDRGLVRGRAQELAVAERRLDKGLHGFFGGHGAALARPR